MTVLTVGTNQAFTTVSSAINAAQDGDTVLVQAGTYVNDFATINHKITLQSVGGLAILQATVSPPNGKAILTVDADAVIDGFGFTGAAVGDANGAGIRYEAGNLVVRNSVFWDNQEGILGGAVSNGTVTIDNSEFSHNGAGDGYSHNIYIGAIASLVVTNSYFHDSVTGHEIKSRAYSTTITNNRILDNNGDGSYDIDLPNGGVAVVTGNVIEKGVNAPNYTAIHFGGEGTPYGNSSLTLANNTIVNDNANGYLLNNQTSAAVTFSNNAIWGFAADHLFQGTTSTVSASGTTTLAARPTLDLSSKAPTVVVAPPVVVSAVPDAATSYVTFGIAGAVVATSHVLTVGGAHGQFGTLAAALLASVDGDRIQVAAGTYVNDFGTVNHKVIIEGVGGIAHFMQQGMQSPPAAMLTVNTDATLRNLEFSGGAWGGNGYEAGVKVTAGNVTIANSKFDGNDIGIFATDNAATSLSVYGSEIGGNGNVNKGTHNVTIGRIGSFTMQGTYVHDALTGHEVSDHAYNSDIENNRIIDGPTAPASFLIGLGQGGNAVIRNNVLEKGQDAQNGVLILVGGEGNAYSNTSVKIDGNTLVSDLQNSGHPYTYFISADQNAANAGPITADGNTFIGGVPGSAEFTNIAGTNSKVATSAVLDTSSPVSGALAAAAPAVAAPGLNTLTLKLAATAGALDAQFMVSVDGIAVGGGRVTTQQSSGATQSFSYTGWWPAGTHQVTVTATNLFSDYSTSSEIGAQSLFVGSIDLDGAALRGSTVLTAASPSISTALQGTTRVPDFDAAFYNAHNPDVVAAHVDALTHYMTFGWREGRDPDAMFGTKAYLAANPDVAAAKVNPLLHYETNGWKEGRDPSVLFSLTAYTAAHPGVIAANVDPLQAAIASGDTKSYADPLLDPAYYHAAKPTTAQTVTDATSDYHSVGWKQGLNPSAWFDTNYYLTANPDVKAAGIDPLQHYEQVGWKEGRSANAWFSASAYTQAHPDTAAMGINPMLSFLESTAATASPWTSPYLNKEAAAFDPAYYLAHNPDVAAAHMDPLVHYEIYGWHEGRDPSAAFSTAKYLAAYADVKAAGVDPLAHYAAYGASEGRHAFAA